MLGKTSIRKAAVDDYSSCLPLFTSLYHGDIGPDFRTTFDNYVAGDNTVVLLAQSRGEIVGILMGSYQIDIDWEGKTARIDAIIVNWKNRRMGIGKKLAQFFHSGEKAKLPSSQIPSKYEESSSSEIS
jgi:ribosomal protein S18 acetylase RimI-like enzyme